MQCIANSVVNKIKAIKKDDRNTTKNIFYFRAFARRPQENFDYNFKYLQEQTIF